MDIKLVENLSMDECRQYLHENPNGELTTEVQMRLNELVAAEETKRKASINIRNRWIDINQLLEKRNYKNQRGSLYLLFFLIMICSAISLTTFYYTSKTSTIYSEHIYEQCNYVYGIENIMLQLNFIEPPYSRDYDSTDFPLKDNYEVAYGFCFVFIPFCCVLLLYILFYYFHSPIIDDIYNIEDGTKSNRYRPIQNKQGKSGLCKLGLTRIIKILPMEYDMVLPAKDNSFICSKNSKYGLYSATLKKMVIPLVYDELYSLEDNSIGLIKDGCVSCFSYKGYRIIE